MKPKYVLYIVLGLLLIMGLDYGFGVWGVFKTGTIGPAQREAERNVYEQTPSFINAKRSQCANLYQDYISDTTEAGKIAIVNVVKMQLVDFDETAYLQPGEIRNFITNCKQGRLPQKQINSFN